MAAAPINEPKQRRSRALQEKVADAGLELLREAGLEAFTIGAVSERAGVSVGAIYRRFGSKEALLRHLHERAMDGQDERTADAFDPERFAALETPALLDAAVRAFVALTGERQELHRSLLQLAALDPEIGARGRITADLQRERFVALLVSRAGDYAHERPEAAAQVVYRLVFGALLPRTALGGYEVTPEMPWSEDVVSELSRACRAYLL